MAREPHREDVRILFVEDNPLDVELVRLQLERDGLHFEWRIVSSEATLRSALREFEPDSTSTGSFASTRWMRPIASRPL